MNSISERVRQSKQTIRYCSRFVKHLVAICCRTADT